MMDSRENEALSSFEELYKYITQEEIKQNVLRICHVAKGQEEIIY